MIKHLYYAAASLIAVLLLLAILSEPNDTPRASTLEVLVQPAAVQQLEAQRLAAQTEQARIAAALEATAQTERTRRTLIIAVTTAAVILCSVAVWGALAISKQRNTIVLLPGSREFDAALLELGGYYRNGLPYVDGQAVKYLEGE